MLLIITIKNFDLVNIMIIVIIITILPWDFGHAAASHASTSARGATDILCIGM